ncbi:hypothetical protein F4808DRAFT_237939 [Astrocystis sublimbata]|nr:hypothetical protein F4808DRAFT_237939 [Astrocystis sublimbata]
MSDSRRVKFSSSPSSPPLRGVLKHPEPNPRDSGVGSSSSDHTGSSGSLDERFTARDYNVQSNNVDALREALTDAIKDIDQWKNKYQKKSNEQTETRRKLREAENRFREATDLRQEEIDRNQKLEERYRKLEERYQKMEERDQKSDDRCRKLEERNRKLQERMENQDAALDVANNKIQDLEEQMADQQADWQEKYQSLDDLYQSVKPSASMSMISGSSGEASLHRGHRDKKGSDDITSRMKERINRDHVDSGSSHGSRSSRSSDATVTTKRPSHRTNASTSDDKPYIEKMPRMSSNTLASPRQPGNYTLTTADKSANSSASRRHGGTSSSSRTSHREHGDYIPHPLPDRSRRVV